MPKKSENKKNIQSPTSFFAGLCLSVLLCMLYLKMGFSPPALLQPTATLQNVISNIAVGIFTDKHDIAEIQREIALDFGWNPDKFIALDTALDNFIAEEYYWQQSGRSKIQELQEKIRAIKRVSGKYPNLQTSLDRLLAGVPEEAQNEHLFLEEYLKKRFPGEDDEEIIRRLDTYTTTEILQRPSVSETIYFEPLTPARVRVEIVNDAGENVRKLIDAELPAGQYWVYWDRTEEDGRKVPLIHRYSYRVFYNDRQEKSARFGDYHKNQHDGTDEELDKKAKSRI